MFSPMENGLSTPSESKIQRTQRWLCNKFLLSASSESGISSLKMSERLTKIARSVAPANSRSSEELNKLAYHEAAHALVAHVLNREVTYLSLIAAGDFLAHIDYHDPDHISDQDIIHDIAISRAARWAEITVFGVYDEVGVSGDDEHAQTIAFNWICPETSMKDVFTKLDDEVDSGEFRYDETHEEDIDSKLQKFINSGDALARSILDSYRAALDALALEAQDNLILTGAEISQIIDENTPWQNRAYADGYILLPSGTLLHRNNDGSYDILSAMDMIEVIRDYGGDFGDHFVPDLRANDLITPAAE